MASVFGRMRALFHRHPLVSNMVICGALYGSGDVSQQTLRGAKKLDWRNSARIAFLACTMFGPIYFYWYRVLDRVIVGTKTGHIATKVLLDQGLLGPPCIAIFYMGTSIMEGRKDIYAELKAKGVKTFLAECVFWLPVQSVNFLYMPSHLRTAYVSAGAFAWSNILCYIKAGGGHTSAIMHETEIS